MHGTMNLKKSFVRLRVLEMSEWGTVLKAFHKVHAVISILTFASGTCCMLQPSTIYPSPPTQEGFQPLY